jgi:glycosyltransferase involved in cell wall biosynthesis
MTVQPAASARVVQEAGPAIDACRQLLRVCFISPLGYGLYNASSGYPFGGAEVQLYLLAGELAQDPDCRATVLVTVREQPGIEPCGPLTVVKRQGRGRLAQGGLLAAVSAFREMFGQLRRIDADVYLHAGAGAEVGAYALICRLLRRRFIYVVASSADLAKVNGGVRGPWRRLFPLGLRLADAVVCRTDEQMRQLKSIYGREGVLIRTGHPVPPSAPAVGARRKSAILWVGRMHPLKQPELFLALAERLPNERFAMVLMRDEVHDTLYRSIRTRAAALPQMAFHEGVAWQDIGRFFEDAKLFVNTSTYEGFPNTFVQAAMQATPILSWAVDPDGVLTRHRIGYCADGSFERLVEETGRLCASESRRADMGRRAWDYARQYHDLRRSVRELKALMQSPELRRSS